MDPVAYATASRIAHEVARELIILRAVASVENISLTQKCNSRARTLSRIGQSTNQQNIRKETPSLSTTEIQRKRGMGQSLTSLRMKSKYEHDPPFHYPHYLTETLAARARESERATARADPFPKERKSITVSESCAQSRAFPLTMKLPHVVFTSKPKEKSKTGGRENKS